MHPLDQVRSHAQKWEIKSAKVDEGDSDDAYGGGEASNLPTRDSTGSWNEEPRESLSRKRGANDSDMWRMSSSSSTIESDGSDSGDESAASAMEALINLKFDSRPSKRPSIDSGMVTDAAAIAASLYREAEAQPMSSGEHRDAAVSALLSLVDFTPQTSVA